MVKGLETDGERKNQYGKRIYLHDDVPSMFLTYELYINYNQSLQIV